MGEGGVVPVDRTILALSVILAFSFSAVQLFTPLALRLSRLFGAISEPLESSDEQRPIPTLGGVALALGILATLMLTFWLLPSVVLYPLWYLLVGSFAVFVLGVFDDVFGFTAWPKLAVETAVAGLVVFASVPSLGMEIAASGSLQGMMVPAGIAVGLVFWVVMVTNGYNLTDGLDGLTAGLSVITAASLGFLGVAEQMLGLGLFFWVIAGCSVGFLLHNTYPASIFLGDCGSLLLGFLIGAGSLQLIVRYPSSWAVLALILVVGVPVFDTGIAVIRRLLSQRPLFDRDRQHVHHVLLRWFNDYPGAVYFLYVIQVISAFTGFVLWRGTHWAEPLVVMSVLLLLFWLIIRKSRGFRETWFEPVWDLLAKIYDSSEQSCRFLLGKLRRIWDERAEI